MKLRSVFSVKEAPRVLYRLLAARPAHVNISHRKMPSFAQHLAFIRKRPYKAWYLIQAASFGWIGSVYLTRSDEIGIFLFKEYQGRGFGLRAVLLLMKKHRGVKRFLANINPRNKSSADFFKKMGFRHIQDTYELNLGNTKKKGKS